MKGETKTMTATARILLALALLTGFASVEAAAQSAPPRKDIPAIAKAADGVIVTIIAAANGKPIAQGTGFLVGADGVVVTNYHVIETGSVAVVKFPDGTVFPVDGVLAADKVRDLAVIKIHGKTFRTLALGDSDAVQVGEEVVAIGNPLSLESTVSNGIISGVRTLKEQGGKLLQTTAPISPGSSGGPLFNMRGEVVGINTFYLKVGENLNFAVPVNDAKLLLSRRSAKLQNLPNEPISVPMDAPHPATAEGPTAQTKDYYVRARRVHEDKTHEITYEAYIIERRGRQLTAQCREAMAWSAGIDKPGWPMVENECTYMRSKIGEHIGEDKMVRQGNELRYRPLAGDETSLQVADILDITDDVPLGAPKHPRPAPKTSPDIQEALRWIKNTLDDSEGDTWYAKGAETGINYTNRMPGLNGCQVTFVYETREADLTKTTFRSRKQVNLGDLDPTSITFKVVSRGFPGDVDDPALFLSYHGFLDPVSMVRVHTTDKVPSISRTENETAWALAAVLVSRTTDLDWQLPSPYAERFVKALHRAIVLCGGKASTF